MATFGCPALVTTDRGPHFEGAFSTFFQCLTPGGHSTSYRLLGHFRRQQKLAFLSTHNNLDQLDAPMVLRSCSAVLKYIPIPKTAEHPVGSTCRLPRYMVAPK